MPTEVKRWLSHDGKEFPSAEKALAHERAISVIQRLRRILRGEF